jgi:hypothetical protein
MRSFIMHSGEHQRRWMLLFVTLCSYSVIGCDSPAQKPTVRPQTRTARSDTRDSSGKSKISKSDAVRVAEAKVRQLLEKDGHFGKPLPSIQSDVTELESGDGWYVMVSWLPLEVGGYVSVEISSEGKIRDWSWGE